ncbi:carbohydrate ABC transporter permease [Leadbettera azotonutricia]|uniref:sn-glycerol-3-phosphate transport system permease protein UgpE n=1 Tax=Leadbettera azotonutricia (strain ATCC BAA-888 / DSM 13862 / ZAS-9) TaxID=545695 RepID=F5YBQ1_LEAAZ|nr:carbohydrate ABC transporter permease [Leadbettera azotonutricia]AEF81597.1 sugar ABC transporter permease [Leadbettera azotonutricia ZAS-9]
MSNVRRHNPGSVLLTILSLIFAFIFIFPLLWSLFVSLKAEGTPMRTVFDWFKPPYTLASYPTILLNSKVPIWFYNSILIAIIATIATILISSLAAYPLAKMEFIGKKKIYFYFLLGLMVPTEATIVPLFITVNGLNLIDSYPGMILPSIAGSMNLIIMVTFFKGIPHELIEVAQLDGARNISIFTRIILPLSRTVLVTVSIFAFMGSWNNYLWPLLCAMGERMFTLPVGLPTLSNTYSVDYVIPSTATMVASIPAIIVFLIFEKQITQGIAMSGIKG